MQLYVENTKKVPNEKKRLSITVKSTSCVFYLYNSSSITIPYFIHTYKQAKPFYIESFQNPAIFYFLLPESPLLCYIIDSNQQYQEVVCYEVQ